MDARSAAGPAARARNSRMLTMRPKAVHVPAEIPAAGRRATSCAPVALAGTTVQMSLM